MASNSPGDREHFSTTHWSLVQEAGDDGRALNELLTRYLPALKAHLVGRWRMNPHDAEDFVQGFAANKLLGRDLIVKADAQKGKFRNLLMVALNNYVKTCLRKRSIECAVGIEVDIEDAGNAPHVFDVAWARQLLAQVFKQMKEECESDGQMQRWRLFEARILVPMFSGIDPPPYDELAQRFGFKSPTQASNVLITAKRMLVRHLRVVVAEYAMEEEIDAELRDLQVVLARSGHVAFDESVAGMQMDESTASENDSRSAAPDHLATLFSAEFDTVELWNKQELPALFRSQLNAPFGTEVNMTAGDEARLSSFDERDPSSVSLADVIFHPSPALELLVMIKRSAKQPRRDESESMFRQVSAVVYLAAISAALTRCNERITDATDAELLTRLKWAANRSWIDDPTRTLFQEAASLL